MEQTLHLKDMLKCNLPGQPVIIQQNEKYRFDVIGDVTSTLSIENRLFINVTPIGMPGQPIFRWRPGTACICRYMKTPIYLMPATPELIKQCNNIRLINEQIPEYNGFKEPDTYTIQRWIYDLQKNDLVAIQTGNRISLDMITAAPKPGLVSLLRTKGLTYSRTDDTWTTEKNKTPVHIMPATETKIIQACDPYKKI